MSGPEKPDQQQLGNLVARAQSGDPRAFEKILTYHQRGLLRFCTSMLVVPGDAEDVLQEVYLTAWRQLSTLHAPEALGTWLYRIARHRCIDHLRKRTPQPRNLQGPESLAGEIAASDDRSGENPESNAETNAAMTDLRRFVHELPANQRECWVLKEIHDLSYADISVIVSEPIATVRGRISRARTTLAERMRPWK